MRRALSSCLLSASWTLYFSRKARNTGCMEAPGKATETGAEGKICPRCGKKNARESLFCDQCGQLLSGGASKGASPNGGYSPYGTPNPNASPYQNPGVPNSPPYQNPGAPNAPYSGPYPFAFDPMGGVRPEEPLGDGVTAGDAAKFVQTNPQYYIPPLSTGSATIGTGSIFPRFSALAVGCFTANNINGAPFSRGLCC